MPLALNPGDLVQLRAGGAIMTVNSIPDGERAEAVWLNTAGSMHIVTVSRAVLQLANVA